MIPAEVRIRCRNLALKFLLWVGLSLKFASIYQQRPYVHFPIENRVFMCVCKTGD